MTGQWEAYLKRIQRGEAQLEPFLQGIEDYVREVVGQGGADARCTAPAQAPQAAARSASPSCRPSAAAPSAATTRRRQRLRWTANRSPICCNARSASPSFRANQEAVCRAVIEGQDVLLVMPTGAGKSLCYQLPGLARGGTTLVISPLIALMEDQVAKLASGASRWSAFIPGATAAASRQACIDYLNGKLQFLFIAPERLRVPGFPEMLAKRKPSLIAIDEAHCISQWGHDFRPDYRMLGQYLPTLRPAPVIALTATATPIVQHDIAAQLGLDSAGAFHPRLPPRQHRDRSGGSRAVASGRDLARELARTPTHRPAIVYTPTRKQAESLAR